MKNNICLSHVVCQNTPSYGNRDHILIRINSSIQKGESANSSCWIFSNNHIGTHLDTPHHFCDTGKKSFDIPVNDFIFEKVQLIDIPCSEARLIDITDLKRFILKIKKDTELLLIRTGYEKLRGKENYWNDNPGLSFELADYFRMNYPDLRCVGFDFISLTSWKFREEGKRCHKAFLCPDNGAKEILVIEDMSLANIYSTINQVIVAPLFVEDGNGGAVTIFANIGTDK